MLDPVLPLAVSIHSGKGVYSVLVGSGVSRSSAIPTGWEIVIDLIKKLAHMRGEDCEPTPEAWYRNVIGSEPDYSDILDQLTQTSAERAMLLRSYFEPTEQEREQGLKLPSPAHRSIATLVAKGYVKVILTTNFDRLMEQALVEAGVQPSVISTDNAVQGALPLVHAPCTLVKVHGDYLDARIRNTRTELAEFSQPIVDLVDRILDEFGLIVCGWSAQWDAALRGAIERCRTHRFGTYWAAHQGTLTGEAQTLIALRRATVLNISSADSFVHDLAQKVQALEDFALVDPLPAKIAVARMKRYLVSKEQQINLHDLVGAETDRVHAGLMSDRFPTTMRPFDGNSMLASVRAYEAETAVLLPMVACAGYWASEAHVPILLRALKRIADDARDENGLVILLRLRRYPAMLAAYAMGIASMASGNYSTLKELLLLPVKPEKTRPEERVVECLTPFAVLNRDYQQVLPGREREHTPLCNHIFETLREPLRDYLPDDRAYSEAFDWFEYLSSLVHCDLNVTTTEFEQLRSGVSARIVAPPGRFVWNHRYDDEGILNRTAFEPEGPYPEIVVRALSCGLFQSQGRALNYERFLLIKRGFDAQVLSLHF